MSGPAEDPKGPLLVGQELADALGVPLPVARAYVKHQRLDGVLDDDGRVSAHLGDVQQLLALSLREPGLR